MGVVSCGTTMLDQGVFENIGAVTWDTTVKTSGFTAVSGNGYFCNTTSAAFTVTLPASPSAGDIVGIKDYANTADTNNITIGRNGSNIQGEAINFVINTEGRSVILVYVDGTKGWLVTSASQASNISSPQFITATGGTIAIVCTDYKIHTFTGPGTFCVSNAGNACGSNTVDYMVIAGGGAGGSDGGSTSGGGGGAGGYRESSGAASGCYSTSPLGSCVSALPVTVTGYPIAVGGGAPASPKTGTCLNSPGTDSSFSTIISAGGGGGGNNTPAIPVPTRLAGAGGSGGGAPYYGPAVGGAGNTPPVSPPQGNNGGNGQTGPGGAYGSGGGGGASAVGANGTTSAGGDGGNGVANSITGSSVTRAGGGGGAGWISGPPTSAGAGGSGGGGDGGVDGGGAGNAGTVNTGGGGGGAAGNPSGFLGGNGGSGIVVIRYKFQ